MPGSIKGMEGKTDIYDIQYILDRIVVDLSLGGMFQNQTYPKGRGHDETMLQIYSPMEYSHQNTSWTGLPEDGGYPDTNITVSVRELSAGCGLTLKPARPAGKVIPETRIISLPY